MPAVAAGTAAGTAAGAAVRGRRTRGVARGGGRGGGRGRGRGRGQAAADVVVEPGWHKTADVDPPNIEPFNHTTGPATLLPPGTEPIRFFEQVFGIDFFESVAEATNLNAVAKSPPADMDLISSLKLEIHSGIRRLPMRSRPT